MATCSIGKDKVSFYKLFMTFTETIFLGRKLFIHIKDELLKGAVQEKVTNAIKKIKEQLFGCYYFPFKVPVA